MHHEQWLENNLGLSRAHEVVGEIENVLQSIHMAQLKYDAIKDWITRRNQEIANRTNAIRSFGERNGLSCDLLAQATT